MEELKQKIIDICNESQLPLEAILFVTRDVYRDVEDALRQAQMQSQIQVKEEKDE